MLTGRNKDIWNFIYPWLPIKLTKIGFFLSNMFNLRFRCMKRFSLKKENQRCVTLICLLSKILIYGKNMTKRRPSWISLSAHRSWTKWPILKIFTFLNLSQPAEENDTKYDIYFTKNKKDEFFAKTRAAILESVRLAALNVFATNFFFHF